MTPPEASPVPAHPTPEQLRAVAAGLASDSALARVEDHLSGCPECCRRLDDPAAADPLLQDLRAAPAAAPDGAPDALLRFKAAGSGVGFSAFAPVFPAPARVGRYEIVGTVGRGGMGTVFQARDTVLYRTVALKLLNSPVVGGAEARERFLREARATAAVTNDHLVPVYGVEDWNGLPCLVMPFVDGESLQVRVERDGPLPAAEIVRVAAELADGLRAAHLKGIVHRDVKPANVLLDRATGRAMLTDFGLARMADDPGLTAPGGMAGTPLYMSPEQAAGRPAGPACDQYGLGATLYFLATGAPPFPADNTPAVLRRVIEDPLMPPRALNPAMPRWLDALIRRLLTKAARGRFPDMAAVAAAVAAGPGWDRAGRTRRRRRAALAAAGPLLLLAGIGWWALPRGEVPPAPPAIPEVTPAGAAAPPLVPAQAEWAAKLGRPVEVAGPAPGMRLRLIPPGEYDMGATDAEIRDYADRFAHHGDLYQREGPRRRVRVSEPFYIAACHVTHRQFDLSGEVNPSRFAPGGDWEARLGGADRADLPVDGMTVAKAARYCNWLSGLEGRAAVYEFAADGLRARPGDGYRLPTDAEWEYAARAGSAKPFVFADHYGGLDPYATVGLRDLARPTPGGGNLPNAFGLFDVLGNMYQLCHCTAADDGAHGPFTPRQAGGVQERFSARGGYWGTRNYEAHVTFRLPVWATQTSETQLGLRVVRTVAAE